MRALVILVAAVLALGSNVPGLSALPQRGADQPSTRKTPPTGAEIAAAARGATLDVAGAVRATLLGKPFKFTPARLPAAAAAKPTTADGFLGVLENGAVGDETGLPAGTYNIFVTQVNGQWKGYAETGGQVVREAIRTMAAPATAPTKPSFTEKGWCVEHSGHIGWIWNIRFKVCY